MTLLVLHPLDTLFFRDGRPYNQDDPGQAEAASVFPPHPPTVVGAVRAALARAMGWPARHGTRRSSATESIGRQATAHLAHVASRDPMFFATANRCFRRRFAWFKEKTATVGALSTGSHPASRSNAILGPRACPPRRVELARTASRRRRPWLTLDGMKRALKGEGLDQSHIVKSDEIWQAEARVGVERDVSTRTTKRSKPEDGEPAKGALYAAAHVRPAKDVAFAVEAGGLPDVSVDGKLAPLGGEGRSAWIKQRDEKIDLPEAPELESGDDGVLHYTVTLITPADIGEEWPGPGDRLAGTGGALPGKVVSACTGRAVAVGGWNGLARRPLPLRPLVPAGSVFFLEAKADEAQAAAGWHGGAIGKAVGWGFGRVLIGRWAPAGGGA